MTRRPPVSTRTGTPLPSTTLCRLRHCWPVIFRGQISPGENNGREKRERKFSQHHWACSGAEVGACSCWPVTMSSCLNSFFTATKNKGTKKIARTVSEIMPPTTLRPIAFCPPEPKSEEHTSELQSLMRISYAVFCLTKITALILKH